MKQNTDNNDIFNLLILLLEDDLDDAQRVRLIEWSQTDPDAVDKYHDFLRDYSIISNEIAGQVEYGASTDTQFDQALWSALAEDEKAAPTVEIETPIAEIHPVKVLKAEKPPRVINKFSLYSAIISMAAVVFLLVYIQVAPPPAASVAMISGSVHAEWSSNEHPTAIGDRLWDNEGPRWLHKGTVKIEFDYGAEVIIEGPAEFELESPDEMTLLSGRLFAAVPERATGFTVHTPNSTVIDLGTEFGIQVDYDGSTGVHMFKGKASLVPGAPGEKQVGLELLAGRAKAVTRNGQVQDIALKNQAFVRKINSEAGIVWRGEDLNLADIVGGGSGFGTGRQGYGVHLETGKLTVPRTIMFLHQPGPFGVRAANEFDFVDCVFVPDGGIGDVEISTTGVVFNDCPDTGGFSWGDPINGGLMYHGNSREPERHLEMLLDGVVYGTKERPAVYMHGNLGITFDLEAIRRAIPGVKMTHLTSLCGISQTVVDDPTYGDIPSVRPIADLWVLVDGESRFSSRGMMIATPPKEMNIPLTDKDRFLTFVVTDADGLNGFDWGIFAEPVIHLVER